MWAAAGVVRDGDCSGSSSRRGGRKGYTDCAIVSRRDARPTIVRLTKFTARHDTGNRKRCTTGIGQYDGLGAAGGAYSLAVKTQADGRQGYSRSMKRSGKGHGATRPAQSAQKGKCDAGRGENHCVHTLSLQPGFHNKMPGCTRVANVGSSSFPPCLSQKS